MSIDSMKPLENLVAIKIDAIRPIEKKAQKVAVMNESSFCWC